MIKRLMILILILVAGSAFAQFEDVDAKKQSITFSAAGQNSNSTTAVTASVPIEQIDGYFGMFLSRQTGDGEVISEVAHTRVKGRYNIIEGYIDLERDIHRGIAFQAKIGYFITPPPFQWRQSIITTGAGNHTASTTVKDDLGIEAPDAVSFGWTAFGTIAYRQTRSTLIVEPDLRFRDIEVEANSSITQKVSEEIEIGATIKAIFDSNPLTNGRFHTQYLLFATWQR